MRKFLAVALVLALAAGAEAGGRSFSGGGGRSFSSGGGRSFSSGGGRSYSGGFGSKTTQSASKTFSGGSKTTPPGKTFSGGSKTTTPDKTFSGGSKPTNTSTGKTYSGGSKGYTGTDAGTGTSVKPGKSNFDSIGTKEQMKVESRQKYEKGQAPKAEYKTADGKTAKIDPKDAKIERLRGQLDQQRWVNRDLRQQQFYGSYYSRPVVIYHDPYPSFFWWWMLDRSLEERSMWAYCHRADMDNARYQAMLAKDAQLEARIRQLEKQGVKADPTYVPKGMEPDLMYSNEYVDAVYNPNPHPAASGGAGWAVLKVMFWIALAVGVVWVVWFVFVRKT